MSDDDTTAPGWVLRNLTHAYTERKPTEWVVNGIFATQSLSAVYGPPGSYKSMLLADLAAHVVAGTPWMPGGANIPVQQCPVLWVDMDNGTRRTDERVDAVAKAHNLPEDAPFYYVSMPLPPLIGHDLESMLLLRDCIRDLGARFVVIDNLGMATGDVEENNSQMALIMGNFRIVAERTGAALVVIHHQRKGGAQGGRAGDALRGHSSIEAALDLALLIVREPNQPQVSVLSTKTRGVDVPPFSGRFLFEHVPGTNDLARAWFEGVETNVNREQVVQDAIYRVLEDGPLTKTLLANRAKAVAGEHAPGINIVRGIIDQMLADGELIERKAQGNKRVIYVDEK